MKTGWIKLYRKTYENPFCKTLEKLGFWTLLLMMASHKENEFYLGNQKISVRKGQFATGRIALSRKMCVSEMKVERWLTCLENEHQIEQQKTNKYRIITIKNWHKYQCDEQQNAQQMNNKRTTDEQQTNTIKNDKNVEECKRTNNGKEKNNFPLSEKPISTVRRKQPSTYHPARGKEKIFALPTSKEMKNYKVNYEEKTTTTK